MLPGRAKDKNEWIRNAKALVDAGPAAFEAANAKDTNALTDIGDKIDETCVTCDAKYLPKQSGRRTGEGHFLLRLLELFQSRLNHPKFVCRNM